MNLYRIGLILVVILLSSLKTVAQHIQKIDLNEDNWIFEGDNFEITTYKGKKALWVKEKGNVNAYLKDSKFKNGTIEFKMFVDGSRNFPGINFRILDEENYENFYIRPHQSGNPDATQYTPVYNGLAAWQLYHGPGYAQAVNFNFDTWVKIKIIVKDQKAEVYMNEVNEPILFIPNLQRNPIEGMVGFTGGKGYYTEFKYSNSSEVILKGNPKDEEIMDEGTVSEWEVSKILFDESKVMSSNDLPAVLNDESIWSKYKTDNRGRLNLSKVHQLKNNKNMVYTKFEINAKSPKIQKFTFGYNDRIKIFFNGRPIYYGNNTFRSRDYRYLGSIGYFDSVYLPIQEGTNEIIIAVAESFGGWGIMGKIE